MFKNLRHRAGLRGAIGVVAAYALALQMLLAGLVTAQVAAADPSGQHVICYGASGADALADNGAPGTQRIHHATCVVCGVAPLSPPPAEVSSLIAVRDSVAAVYVAPAGHAAIAVRRHDPKSAQGPPQTV